jgi:ABC-type glycerol-3-phosphate transport system substrate-binding protein
MNKVKLFTGKRYNGDPMESLEKSINEWLEENPNITVISQEISQSIIMKDNKVERHALISILYRE